MWTDVLMPISIMGTFGTALYFFTKVVTDYILKKKMIDKGYVGDDTQSIFKSYGSDNRYASLKWGLLALSGGIAFIIMHVLGTRPDTPLPYGIFAVSLSVGFLVYYFMVKHEVRK
jgi:hypothetical protein